MTNAELKTPRNLAAVAPMDIYSKKGAEVVFTGLRGYDYQKKRAAEFLEVGKTYTVEATEVGQSSSTVQLQGIDTTFNTVHFIGAEEYRQLLTAPQDPFGGASSAEGAKAARIEALRSEIAKMQSELDGLEKDEAPSPI